MSRSVSGSCHLGVRAEWQYARNGHVLSVSEVGIAVSVCRRGGNSRVCSERIPPLRQLRLLPPLLQTQLY